MSRVTVLVFLTVALASASVSGGDRKQRRGDVRLADAPAKVNALQNPYEGQPDAVLAGAKLYQRHCAKCHGDDATGSEDAPSLRGPLVQNASPGALFWFLKNGNMRSGMPSWSGLPEQRRWQLVSYLKSLKPEQDKTGH